MTAANHAMRALPKNPNKHMSWMLGPLHFKRAGTGKAYTTLLFQGKFRLIEAVYRDIHYANFQNFLARIDLLMRCQVVKF